mmetsp:Transcript_11362/g.25016  ORF Transcript_11362/g.25016 Transcript_11362/m.25016 type:complete len:405 (-) Transcript_11362:317-1531(-)
MLGDVSRKNHGNSVRTYGCVCGVVNILEDIAPCFLGNHCISEGDMVILQDSLVIVLDGQLGTSLHLENIVQSRVIDIVNSSAEQNRKYVLSIELGDLLQPECLEKTVGRLGDVCGMDRIVVRVLGMVGVSDLFDELLPAFGVRDDPVNQIVAVHKRGEERRQGVAVGCGIKLPHIIVPLPGLLSVQHGQRLRGNRPQILHRQHRWSSLVLSLGRGLLLMLLGFALRRRRIIDPCVGFLVKSTSRALLGYWLVQIPRRNHSTSKLQVTARLAVQNSRSLQTLKSVQNPISRHCDVATAATLQPTGGGLGLTHLAENDDKSKQTQDTTQAQDLIQHFIIRNKLQDGQPHGHDHNEAIEHVPRVTNIRLPECNGLQEDLNQENDQDRKIHTVQDVLQGRLLLNVCAE